MWSRKPFYAPRIIQPGGVWYRRGALLVLLAASVVVSVWYAFDRGRASAGFNHIEALKRIEQQDLKIVELEDQRAALRQKVAVLERSAQIDRTSVVKMREQIKKFQRERLDQEEELTFLRGIVSTESKKPGLRIQGFHLKAAAEARSYEYQFTVSQVLKNIGLATGRIWITIDGVQGGRSRSLALQEVTSETIESVKMRFRYFQIIEGLIRLPRGFSPASFNVEVKPSNKKLAPVAQNFKWIVSG